MHRCLCTSTFACARGHWGAEEEAVIWFKRHISHCRPRLPQLSPSPPSTHTTTQATERSSTRGKEMCESRTDGYANGFRCLAATGLLHNLARYSKLLYVPVLTDTSFLALTPYTTKPKVGIIHDDPRGLSERMHWQWPQVAGACRGPSWRKLPLVPPPSSPQQQHHHYHHSLRSW